MNPLLSQHGIPLPRYVAPVESQGEPQSMYRLYPDSDYVCRITETRYPTGNYQSRSWLGGLVNGQYTTRTEAFFAKDGKTLLRMNWFDLTYYSGTSVLKSEVVNTTKSIANAQRVIVSNDLIRVKSNTPSEVWTNYTQWTDYTVFNGTSNEKGTTMTPFSSGIQYAEFKFEASNTSNAIIGIALGSFDLQTGVIGDSGTDSISYDTQTAGVKYNGSVIATGGVFGATDCTYGFIINTETNGLAVYRIVAGTPTLIVSTISPMPLSGGYFVYSGKDPYVRTKFRTNYGDFGWDYQAGSTGTFGTCSTFK